MKTVLKTGVLNGDLISVHSWHTCVYFPSCFILYHICLVCINAYELTLMDDRKNKTTDQTWTNGLMSLTIWKIISRHRGKTSQMCPHIRNTVHVQAGINALLNH